MSKGLHLIQQGLVDLGYQPGPPDGLWGPQTRAAVNALAAADGAPRQAAQAAPVALAAPSGQWPRQAAVAAFYGPAGGADCTAGRCILPFAFPLAWDDSQRVESFACHVKVASAMTAMFAEAARHYGEAAFRRLRLDRFGGCYNYRKMRGSTSLSMHAWGIAVDLDPVNNQLSWGKDRATFARPDYDTFWQIVEGLGATSLGRVRNMDFMHLQFAAL